MNLFAQWNSFVGTLKIGDFSQEKKVGTGHDLLRDCIQWWVPARVGRYESAEIFTPTHEPMKKEVD